MDCPVCGKQIPIEEIQQHVNMCLDASELEEQKKNTSNLQKPQTQPSAPMFSQINENNYEDFVTIDLTTDSSQSTSTFESNVNNVHSLI